MTPMELIPLLDTGMVEELRMYYNGHHSVVDIRNIPCTMPDYQIAKMWNSENGKGISVLLADNMAEDPEVKMGCDWYDIPSDLMTLEQARQAVKDLRTSNIHLRMQLEKEENDK
jgi:hypothetical protein